MKDSNSLVLTKIVLMGFLNFKSVCRARELLHKTDTAPLTSATDVAEQS